MAESWKSGGLKYKDKCITEAYSPGPEVRRQRGQSHFTGRQSQSGCKAPRQYLTEERGDSFISSEIPSTKLQDIRRIKVYNVYDSI